jgi:hypothetical protein
LKPVETLEPCLVQEVPAQLDPGKLYISIEYGSINHLCACGCGHEVVTPLHPARWAIYYNGDTISLWPSVGSVGLPCRSHYVIECNRVVWLAALSDRAARAGAKRDRSALAAHHATPLDSQKDRRGWWRRWSRRQPDGGEASQH